MAETGNSIVDATTISDMLSRLAAVEAALGKTNAVTPSTSTVSGFEFFNGDNASKSYGIGSIKILTRRLVTPGYRFGNKIKAGSITLSEFAGATKVWVTATPAIRGDKDTTISCHFVSAGGGVYDFYVNSTAVKTSGQARTGTLDVFVVAYALYDATA